MSRRRDRDGFVEASIAARRAIERAQAVEGGLSRTALRTLLAIISEVALYSRVWDQIPRAALAARAGFGVRSVRVGLRELHEAGVVVVDQKTFAVSLDCPRGEDMSAPPRGEDYASAWGEDMSAPQGEGMSAARGEDKPADSIGEIIGEISPGSIPGEKSLRVLHGDDRLEGDIADAAVARRYLEDIRRGLPPKPGSREWVAAFRAERREGDAA